MANFMHTGPLAMLAAAVMLPWPQAPGGESNGAAAATAPATTEATIPGDISDGSPSPPPPPVEKPDYRILSTQVKQMEVVKAPEMPELPPVEGTVTITVHTVSDPGLPDPPPPLPALAADDPQVQSRLAEMRANHGETRILFLSATVFDHSRTFLRCFLTGTGNAGKEITAWSNLDFNRFCGFGEFEAKGADGEVRKYALLMAIGNEDTARRCASLAAKGIENDGPVIPALPDDKPAFLIQTEDPDPAGVTLVEDLHALYRCEGARMAEACAAREKAREERKAFLLAHPPKPEDVTIHFWKREKPTSGSTATEGTTR